MRIAILGLNYAPEPTGNSPYTSSLAEGLVARGYKVRVVTSHPHYPEWKIREGYGQWKLNEVVNHVPVTRLRHFVPKKPNGIQRLVSEISFGMRLVFARWGNPDVVLLVSPALVSSYLALTRIKYGPRRPATAIWVQDLYSLGIAETGDGGGLAERVLTEIESRTFRGVDGVAVIHQRFANHAVKNLGAKETSLRVIRNWTHLPPAPEVDVAATRSALGWGDSEVVVLHAGNMGKKQGLENIVDAARLADQRGAKVRFVLMGGGNQRSMLIEASRGVERIQFLDPLPNDEFQAALAAADVLIVNELPGLAEMAVPSKLTSYFSTGRPVIAATDEGSVTAGEIEASGGGVRVDAGKPDQLVDAVVALGADESRAAELGRNGIKYRMEVLSSESAIDNYAEWLVSLAAERGR
ncbi:glycosyltransferase [Herbiconiux sp. CPCC 203386]|uniref:Glycosyltransferase n=1 Tax=Herbiconiux daphne TaxID=2970914 RepID=A0ABT2H6K1_9MICO|nr:glycosyltransferase [Herbiconiux daphne]